MQDLTLDKFYEMYDNPVTRDNAKALHNGLEKVMPHIMTFSQIGNTQLDQKFIDAMPGGMKSYLEVGMTGNDAIKAISASIDEWTESQGMGTFEMSQIADYYSDNNRMPFLYNKSVDLKPMDLAVGRAQDISNWLDVKKINVKSQMNQVNALKDDIFGDLSWDQEDIERGEAAPAFKGSHAFKLKSYLAEGSFEDTGARGPGDNKEYLLSPRKLHKDLENRVGKNWFSSYDIDEVFNINTTNWNALQIQDEDIISKDIMPDESTMVTMVKGLNKWLEEGGASRIGTDDLVSVRQAIPGYIQGMDNVRQELDEISNIKSILDIQRNIIK